MKMNRREFMKSLAVLGAAIAAGVKVFRPLQMGGYVEDPDTITVRFGRPVPLLPCWGISADEIQSRIEELKNNEIV